jgi:hypothetical protein
MRSMKNITVGIRLQASIVIGASLLWFVSLPGCAAASEKPGLRFGDLVSILCTFLALVFTALLWWSYLRSGRPHGRWVAAATLAILSPLIVGLLIYAAGH